MNNKTPTIDERQARTAELNEWRRTNRFCGCCGMEMKIHENISLKRYNTFGIDVPYWVDSLEKCIKNIISEKRS